MAAIKLSNVLLKLLNLEAKRKKNNLVNIH